MTTLQRRILTGFVFLPAASTANVELGALTFTPPDAGTAVVAARGYCNLTGGSTPVSLDLGLGTDLDVIFDDNNWSEHVALNLPAGSLSANHQIPWTTETTLAVQAGQPTTVYLAARREQPTDNAANCVGSLKVELMGDLP